MILYALWDLAWHKMQGMAISSNSKDIMDNSQIITIKVALWLLHSKDIMSKNNSLEDGSKDGTITKCCYVLQGWYDN